MTNAWTTPRTWVDGEVVGASLGNAHWRDNQDHLYDRSQGGLTRGWSYSNDFLGVPTDGTMSSVTSGGTVSVPGLLANAYERPGQVRIQTNALATDRASVASVNLNQVAVGGGELTIESSLYLQALSTVTDRYQLLIGLVDSITAVNQTNGVYFLYDEGGVSTSSTAAAYWQTATVGAATRSFNTSLTQVTVAISTWVGLKIVVNAARTSVAFYINGTQVATHTANIPLNTATMGFGIYLQKSIGVTSRYVQVDYFRIGQYLTTAR